METPETYHGSCHCKEVLFKVKLSNEFKSARRCSCSFCRMRGAIAVSAFLKNLTIIKGKKFLTEYTFNTKKAKHYFCKQCGIYTFHQRRSNPDQFGVNVSCLENISPFDFKDVQVLNGHQHPKDNLNQRKSVLKQFGRLKFIQEEIELENDPSR